MSRGTADMDADTKAELKFHRWLPYWAVLQTDLRQTVRGWVYRMWVVLTVAAAGGFLLYRLGVYWEAGLIQSAADLSGGLLRGLLLGSLALIAVLTAGSIAAERGTLADSVLSRGISRHQYFLAKWHARLAVVLGTALAISAAVLLAAHFLLDEGLSLGGCVAALAGVAALLAAVVSCGVAVSSAVNGTLFGVALMWALLYGGGFLFSLLPEPFPSPERALRLLPGVLRGEYNLTRLTQVLLACVATTAAAGSVGVVTFARRDV